MEVRVDRGIAREEARDARRREDDHGAERGEHERRERQPARDGALGGGRVAAAEALCELDADGRGQRAAQREPEPEHAVGRREHRQIETAERGGKGTDE